MRFAFISPVVLAALSAGALAAQAPDTTTARPTNAATDQALIANALSAAPQSVAATATVQTADGRVLRKGTSDWVCMPDMPEAPNNSPMCLDAEWRSKHRPLRHRADADQPMDPEWRPPHHGSRPRPQTPRGHLHRPEQRRTIRDVEGHPLCPPHGPHRPAGEVRAEEAGS